MSFGKDKSRLNLPSFRAQQQQTKSAGGGGGGGGRRPHWIGQYRPTDASVGDSDRVRLYRGEHAQKIANADNEVVETTLSYLIYTMHGTQVMRNGKSRFASAICAGGPLAHIKEKREECLGCERHWEDKNSMSRMSQNAFTMLHFGDYAKVIQTDDKGQPKINNKTKEPFFDWERTDPVLLRNEHKGLEIRDYNLLHWSLGYRDYNKLGTYADDIAKACLTCGGKQSVSTVVWLCKGCGAGLIDPSSGMYKPEDIARLTASPVQCGQCKHEDYLEEVLNCSKCNDPVRADIFDVDLFVKKPKDPKTGKTGELLITGWDNVGPIEDRFLEGETPIFHELDLPRIYAPHSYAEQQEIFGSGGQGRNPSSGGKAWGSGGKAPVIGG